MDLRQRIIPCSDYPDWKVDLEIKGYEVLGSQPDPNRPGFCTLSFQSPPEHVRGPDATLAAAFRGAALPAAALSDTQKRTAHAIVNIFETGAVLGMYGQVTVIDGDSGHLTFGRSQTTLSTGNLARLIGAYCDNAGARFGARLKPYLPVLRDRDISLDHNTKLHNLLRATADDPVMRDTQDAFFDRTYWDPAAGEAAAMDIRTPLGVATVYDSVVHGSWSRLRAMTDEQQGTIAKLGEKTWIKAYIATRRSWLATHPRHDLRPTVYRMDTLAGLANQDHWALELPLLVRDHEISEVSLAARPPGSYDGPAAGSRALAVATPFARGADVRLVQLGLSEAGLPIKADGVFGSSSSQVVKQFQQAEGLPVTGVADIGLIARLAV
jgi:chitosanase